METLYERKPSFLVLTGKRRVGKTSLIKKFSEGKRSLYLFVDSNKSRDILLSEYEGQMRVELGLAEYVRFKTPAELISFLLEYKEGLIVVFDEFQRFLYTDPSFITELQKQWDLKAEKSRIFLIASGSSIGMIKKIFIEKQAPLFKRADNILTLRPFSMKETFGLLDGLGVKSVQEKLDLYCFFGGIIYYYRLMEKYGAKSLKDAIEKLILNELAPLKNEVRDILIEEFGKEHATYYEILSAMAAGKSTKKEIGDATHISPSSLSPYFYDLIELVQLAEYAVPVTETMGKTKKGRYFLRDNFFRFYFRFIYKNMSSYEAGNYGLIREKIASEWGDFRGRSWERTAIEFARKKLADKFPQIGSFWDRSGNEIDLVGINRQTRELLLAEAKSKELSLPEARAIIAGLQGKQGLLPLKFENIRYGIMAPKVSGREKLEKEGHLVWELEDILKV